ncbi:carbohydrate-binding domain-containing protein [Ureibacillus sp. NPDC094379]
MKEAKFNLIKAATPLLCTALLFGCSGNTEKTTSTSDPAVVHAESLSTIGNQEIASVISEKVSYDDEDFYTEWKDATSIKLNGDSASFEGNGAVVIDGSTITIRAAGVYEISGKINDGQIIVDAEDDGHVRLVLNGAEINSSSSAPIFVQNAGKTVISLEEGTENVLSDGDNYVYEKSDDDEPNAALFSKDNLTINGSGSLIVNGNFNDGITSKDELRITGGTIQIKSVDDGLIGRDLLAVKDGNIQIKAGGDGIKSTNDKDADKALIAIEDGTFDIEATNDGIQAETTLLVAKGEFDITTGGGSPETIETNENNPMSPFETPASTSTETSTDSAKGLKAGVEVAIGGGSFTVNSLDDAVHSNSSITITGGSMNVASGDDGIHADQSLLIKGGDLNVTKSYEGLESKAITIADGKIQVNAADDGINIGGGNDSSGRDFATTENSEDNLLSISGGLIYVNAAGDGLDSNGSIAMTDGTVIVSGPTNNNNGALDYDQSFEQSGGFLIATGSSGMAMATSDTSSQNAIIMTYPEVQTAGTLLHLEDDKGNTIATFAPEKDYQTAVISSPELVKDTSYTLYSGGTASGSETNGLYSDGNYQSGTSVVEFSIADTITWLNETGVTEAQTMGHGGGMGGPGGDGAAGNRKDMFSDLDDETREKVQSIMEQQRNGTITQEEAQAQLEELGVEFPTGGPMGSGPTGDQTEDEGKEPVQP